jgi:hypothetical protein
LSDCIYKWMTIDVILTVLLVDQTGETIDKLFNLRLYQIHLARGENWNHIFSLIVIGTDYIDVNCWTLKFTKVKHHLTCFNNTFSNNELISNRFAVFVTCTHILTYLWNKYNNHLHIPDLILKFNIFIGLELFPLWL